jgi:hypothetical protein
MISKPVDNTIPNRSIKLNECGFNSSYHVRNIILEYNKPAPKAIYIKISKFDTLSVRPESC